MKCPSYLCFCLISYLLAMALMFTTGLSSCQTGAPALLSPSCLPFPRSTWCYIPCKFGYSLLMTLTGPWGNLLVINSNLFVVGPKRLSICMSVLALLKNFSLLFKISILFFLTENTIFLHIPLVLLISFVLN